MRHAAPKPARALPAQPRLSRSDGKRKPGRRRSASAAAVRPEAQAAALTEVRPEAVRWGQLPYALIVAGVLIALGIIMLGTHHLKSGTLVLAGILLVAAIARLVLPDRLAGMLSTRRRLLDVAIFAALGFGLLAAGLGVAAPG
jgi:hypothetical protein